MSIRVDETRCVGCGKCTQVCPGSLLELRDGKAVLVQAGQCWGCASCLKECRNNAVAFYLEEEQGGSGMYMNVERRGSVLVWHFFKDGRRIRSIEVDGTQSNNY